MICSKCGEQIDKDDMFCPACGATTQANPDTVFVGTYNPQPETPPDVSAYPMKWFKFLIYIALFAGAALNAISGIQYLTGSLYGEEKDLVYQAFPAMETLGTVIGIALLAVALLGVVARFRLAGFHRDGPKLLTLLYLSVMVVDFVFVVGLYSALPVEVADLVDKASMLYDVAVAIVMIIVNKKYFRERDALFVK